MSREDNDERRLYQCARKYEKIVKQFDGLIEMMNARTRPPKRRRRVSTKSKGDSTSAASPSEPDNEVFEQTITQFLKELRADSGTDSDSLTSTPEQ